MNPLRNIVVATDFRPLAQAATRRAAFFARLDDASIHLVHVLRFPLIATPYEISVPGAIWEGVRAAAQREMEAVKKTLSEQGVSHVTGTIEESVDPVESIEKAIEAHQADLIVLGTHGRIGLGHALLGSVAERALRRIEQPVLAVKEDPAKANHPIDRILLATDFSPDSDQAGFVAADLAARLGASLDVVHAFDFPADYLAPFAEHVQKEWQGRAAEKLDSLRCQLANAGVSISLHLRKGRASEVIPEAAEALRAQLIVMGRRGNSGFSHVLFGSVAERTMRAAACSVLTVRGVDVSRSATANAS